jgi:hypothetical protein
LINSLFCSSFPLRLKLFSTLERAIKVIVIGWSIAFLSATPMLFIVVINRLPLPDFAINQSWTARVWWRSTFHVPYL